jgi:hypothetical protein
LYRIFIGHDGMIGLKQDHAFRAFRLFKPGAGCSQGRWLNVKDAN